MTLIRRAALILTVPCFAVAALAGCSSEATQAPTATTSNSTSTSTAPSTDTTTTTAAPTTTESTESDAADSYFAGAAEMGCIAGDTLADGRWFGFIPADGIHVDDGIIDFDLACWFAGPEADAAGEARGEEVTNDYLIVNDNADLRTVPASMTAAVTFFPSGDPSDVSILMLSDWPEARLERGFDMGVWIEIVDGTVSKVEERWVP